LRLEALALARQHDDPETLFRATRDLLSLTAQHWDEVVLLAEEAYGWPRQGLSGNTLGIALWTWGCLQFAGGERARAEELWRQMEEVAERTHIVTLRLRLDQRDTWLAIVDGRLEEAFTRVRRFVEHADASGASLHGRQVGAQMLFAPAVYLGREEDWLAAFDEFARVKAPSFRASALEAGRALCLAQLGRINEALMVAGPVLDEVIGGTLDDETPCITLLVLLQSTVVLGQVRAAQALAARVASLAHLSFATHSTGWVTCIARHLGDAARLAGERVAARSYYLQALESAGKIRFRPELALTRLRLAELVLEERDDSGRSEALEHLDIAIPELRDMKMQPALERALSLLEQVEPLALPPAPDVTVSHVLTGRERDVARLLVAGRSNREIADALVITEGTVEVHVKHVLSKLGLRSRAQVAARASDERL
jgi:DNA-binding CsgD family transcriptional regulator